MGMLGWRRALLPPPFALRWIFGAFERAGDGILFAV